jgi:CheY-like chemotaxis protein
VAARIAVIDDDDATRELMQTILEGAGYGVDVAGG